MVTARGADIVGSPSDAAPLQEILRRQLIVLFSRHRPEDAILVRVLTDYYQHVAKTAKAGRLEQAKAELAALASEVPVPPSEELNRVVDVAALPVRALLSWREGDCDGASRQLREALDACAELATRWGHHYLTGRQLHLAINVARVQITAGDHRGAVALLAALRSVADGDRSRWPFPGASALEVPLTGLWRAATDEQLESTARHLTGGAR